MRMGKKREGKREGKGKEMKMWHPKMMQKGSFNST